MRDPACTPAAGARALYLAGGERKQVTASEAALIVTNVTNARAQHLRYPVLRVARVVSSASVDWSGAALQLCQRTGIVITWLDGQGGHLGTLYPQSRSCLNFSDALNTLLDQPGGFARYGNWLRSRRMDVLVHCARNNPKAINLRLWEDTKRKWVYGAQLASHLPLRMHGYCMALVAHRISAEQLTPVYYGRDGQLLELDHDLCGLLWAELNLRSGSMADTVHSDAEAIALFERWHNANGSSLLLHLSSLRRFALRELGP